MKLNPMSNEPLQRPFLIAGPCSAESEEQVMTTARELATRNIDLFRAGIWKPRTRPGSFEGVGTVGLKWLKKVKEETGLKVTTEVANKQHVFEALKHGVDALWIGARTTVSPFAVQEIADALEGVDIPVFIKNPVNPDLSLWMGAIERIKKAGISNVGVIHRGFSSFGDSKYRNIPQWQIPIELMQKMPELVVICDNSHICGRRDILHEVAQKSLDLNFDGLMTESHPNPDEAWSDARQQITPTVYKEMIGKLVVRAETTDDQYFLENIEDLRHKIDQLDTDILNLLGKRMDVAKNIGRYKKQNNISILQPTRWSEILDKAAKRGAERGLSVDFISQLLKAVHQESINHQEQVMKEKEAPKPASENR